VTDPKFSCEAGMGWRPGIGLQSKERSMYYGPYYDPTGRTQFIKELWDKTNKNNDAFAKRMSERRAQERRYRADAYPDSNIGDIGNRRKRGGGGLFWFAALAFLGGVLLQLF
jgi:hypothetical protein